MSVAYHRRGSLLRCTILFVRWITNISVKGFTVTHVRILLYYLIKYDNA